jgi:nuclear pore complex protein Nup205
MSMLTNADIDNATTLRQYYDLLLSVIRIIISATLSRGINNQQTLEHTRQFLTENRQSMVGIFKRYANIGAIAPEGTRNDLGDLVKSFVALITMAGFVDFEEEKARKPGRRGFT